MNLIQPAPTHRGLFLLVCRVLPRLGLGLFCLALTPQVPASQNIADHSAVRPPVASVFYPNPKVECAVSAFIRGGKAAVFEDRFTGPGFLKIGVQYPPKRLSPIPGGKVWRFGFSAAVSPDGKLLATTFSRANNGGRGLCLWSLTTSRPLLVERDAEPWTHFDWGSPIAFSMANRYVAYLNENCDIVVRNVNTGSRLSSLVFPKGIGSGYSPSRRIAFAGDAMMIGVTQFHITCWDIATEKVVWVRSPPAGLSGFSGSRVAVIRNGKELAVAAYPSGRPALMRKWAPDIALYDVKTGQVLGSISVPAVVARGARRKMDLSLLVDLVATRDGRYLIAAENGEGPFPHGVAEIGRLVVANIADHRIVYTSRLCQGGLWSVAVSPNGRFVLASEPTRFLLFRVPRQP